MKSNDTETIFNYFHKYVKERPDAIAVADDRRELSYTELDKLADSISTTIPAGSRMVGIVMDHSIEMIASIIAVLKCGAAFIPIEPDMPQERALFMLCECSTDAVITQHKHAQLTDCFRQIFIERDIVADPEQTATVSNARPDSLACVLYTSGSTGLPKGVMIENRNICHHVRAFCHEFKPKVTDRIIQLAACTDDIFVREIFSSILSGAGLVIPPEEMRSDIGKLMKFIGSRNVTILIAPPHMLQEMNRLDHVPSSLRLIISSGGTLRQNDVSRLIPQTFIYNSYGHTETTACTTYFRCNGARTMPDGTYPIGRPAKGTTIVLLDSDLNRINKEGTGEICIMGSNVARGYIRTRENGPFINLVGGGTLYCSGDIGQRLNDGSIAYLHRKDSRVTIMGQRVEPCEVESIICNCNCIEDCVVRPVTDNNGTTFLAAYIVPRNRLRFRIDHIKQTISRFLPPYMIPEFFIKLRRMPVTETGEVNFAALPAIAKIQS